MASRGITRGVWRGAGMNVEAEIPPEWRVALDLLRRLGCGGVVIDNAGRIVARNSVAARLVGDWTDELPPDVRKIVDNFATASSTIEWLRRRRGAPLIVHLIAHPPAPAAETKLLVLIDPGQPGRLDEGVVRNLFGLTAAESNLAVRLARGERVRAIAQARGVGIGTVRTQLRTIFRKTRTKSQASLVLLLARLATIQPDASDSTAAL